MVVVALAVAADYSINLSHTSDRFWDFRTYLVAMHLADKGLDPYSLSSLRATDPLAHFPFVYPPNIVWLFRDILAGPYEMALRVYLVALLIALVAIYSFQRALLFQGSGRWIVAIALLATLGRVTFKAFLTGNIAILLYGILAFGLWALVRGRAVYFYGAILIASQFKFFFLSLLLVPFILAPAENFWPASVVVAIYAVETLIIRWANPNLFASFLSTAHTQFLHEFYDEHNGLFGLASYLSGNVFGGSDVSPSAVGFTTALYGMFATTIMLVARRCVAHERVGYTLQMPPEVVAYLWLSAVLCFPRLGTYDLPALILPVACLINRVVWPAAGALVVPGFVTSVLVGLYLLNP
ncbi:MAG: hypothetical protein KGO02_12815 [Alphaproteobacteria bacterium]|nr:hypothetical protein [Alphaproteobacteria bacterium]